MSSVHSPSYCMYLRKSRADRDAELQGQGETLARHKKILDTLAEGMGITIGRVYSEVVSGETIDDRPAVQELLHDVSENMWDGVLVVEVERLARGNTRDQGTIADIFKYSNTKIITPSKTYDPNNEFDEEFFEFGLFMSRREYKTINRRLQRGRLSSVTEGKYVCSTAPYGYIRVKIPDGKGYTLAIDEEKAPIVRMIFDWYGNGIPRADGSYERLGAESIARRLDSMGIKPAVNDSWSKASIMDMLKNPTYMGMVRFGYRREEKHLEEQSVRKVRRINEDCQLIRGIHPAIIDESLFNQVQQVRRINQRNTVPSNTALQNPLSGLVYCAKCGSMMTRLAPNSRNRYSTLKCPNRYCDNISSPLHLVEEEILSFLKSWMETYEFRIRKQMQQHPAEKEIENRKSMLARIEKESSTVRQQIQKTYSLLEQEVYTLDVFQERQQSLKSELEQLETSRDSLIKEIEDLRLAEQSRTSFLPKIKSLVEAYHDCGVETRNKMLSEVLQKVTYEKSSRNRKGELNKTNFTLCVYPKVPK